MIFFSSPCVFILSICKFFPSLMEYICSVNAYIVFKTEQAAEASLAHNMSMVCNLVGLKFFCY